MALQLNIRQLLGKNLVENGIINYEQLVQALEIQECEPEQQKRKLPEILTDDLGVDRHAIRQALCEIYAIRQL